MNFSVVMASVSRFRWRASLFFLIPLALVFCCGAVNAAGLSKPFDHSQWDQFLKTYVNEKGEVDYAGVQKDPTLLNDYLKTIEGLNAYDVLMEWPREEKLALFLNLYHAAVIKMVVDHYPLMSIQDIPGVWDLPIVSIGSDSFSLNGLRQAELISTFRDEKIHLALACGARGCPPLSDEAFTGPRVEGQLYVLARRYVNNPENIRIDTRGRIVHLPRIFKWYAGDFTVDFGRFSKEDKSDFSSSEKAVLNFLAYYHDDPQMVRFLQSRDFKIEYDLFDWDLNDVSPAMETA